MKTEFVYNITLKLTSEDLCTFTSAVVVAGHMENIYYLPYLWSRNIANLLCKASSCVLVVDPTDIKLICILWGTTGSKWYGSGVKETVHPSVESFKSVRI